MKQMHHHPLMLATITAASTIFSSSLYAQAKESSTADSADKMENTVVVASRMPKSISDIPATVWFIDSEQIQNEYKGGKSLGEILSATVPALDVSSGSRNTYGQNLRGRPMLVMIDGVSMKTSRSMSRQLESIDPFNIDRIEVLSGATSIYGAGATGGVINIITKKGSSGETQFESYIGGTSGFNRHDDFDYKVGHAVSGGSDTVSARAAAIYTKSQGYFDADGDIIAADNTQGSLQYNKALDLQTTIGLEISDTQHINFLAQYYDSQQDSPYGVYIVDRQFIGVRDGFHSDRQQGTKRRLFSLDYTNNDIFFDQQFIAQASYRTEDHTFTPFMSNYKNDPYINVQSASQQKTEVTTLKAAFAKSFFSRLNLTYGLDAYRDKFESNAILFNKSISEASGNLINIRDAKIGRYPGIEVGSLAGFVQADLKITDNWSIEGGYRYQYIKNTIDNFVPYDIQTRIALGNGLSADPVPGGKTSYSVGVANLGTIYKLNHYSQIWANFSQGFDLADPAKYYGKGKYETLTGNNHELQSSININDSKMSGIKTDSYEIGYRMDNRGLSLQTATYLSQSDGSIKYNSKTQLIESVKSKQRVYGVEALASYWLTDHIQAGLSGHYVKSETKTNEGWYNSSASNASTSKASSWVSWSDADLDLKLQSETMFDYKDDANKKLDGYTVFNLIGSYQLPVGNLGFGIQNLLNKDYVTAWGQRAALLYSAHYPADAYDYRGRGRTFSLNYQVTY